MSPTPRDEPDPPMEEETVEEEEQEYTVEAIRDKKKEDGQTMYLIKWEGYDEDANTWEPLDNLNCASLIQEFEEELARKKRTSKVKQSATKRQVRNSTTNGSTISKPPESSDTEDDEVQEIIQKRPSKTRKSTEKLIDTTPEPPAEKPKGFARNLNLDDNSIQFAAYDEFDKLYFMVRWKNTDMMEMIPVEELEEYAPRELCVWYRKRLFTDIALPKDKQLMELFLTGNENIDD